MRAFLASSRHGILDTQAITSELGVFSNGSEQKTSVLRSMTCEKHWLTVSKKQQLLTKKWANTKDECTKNRVNKDNKQQRKAKWESRTKENTKKTFNFAASAPRVPPAQKSGKSRSKCFFTLLPQPVCCSSLYFWPCPPPLAWSPAGSLRWTSWSPLARRLAYLWLSSPACPGLRLSLQIFWP